MMRRVTRFLLPLVVLLVTALAGAQDETDPKYSAAAEKTAKERQAAIRKELKGVGNHAWAGEYYVGDGLGMNLRMSLAPESGYVFEWHGCLGLYDRNYGSITQEADRIRLQLTFANRRGSQTNSTELLPIHWGDRHYLVPTGGVIRFCNAVNDGSEPRANVHGNFLLRQGDEQKPVKGFPKVPPKYEAYLLAKPVTAEIVSVGKYTTRPSVIDFRFKDTPVTLNKGTNHGLLVGMELHVINPKNMVESVEIVGLGPDRCDAIMTQFGEEFPGPKAGWQLSTRPSWRS